MGLVHHTNIVTDGLIFCADPANKRCYSGSGDTCTDLAGGVTGSLENQTALSSDWNGVFDFDGTDDYIDFGSPAALQNQVGTVIGWGRWDNSSTAQGGLVSYLYNHSSLAHGWNLLNHGTYKIGRSLASNGTYDYWTGSTSYQFDKDEWVMASFSFAGQSNPVITYRNDVAINTDSSQDTILTYTGANLVIGRTDTAVYLKEWFGQIGPIYIYNRALTQDEITQMYEALKPRFKPRITTDGLFASWDAGDPESYSGGTTWKDTANHYDGTLENDDDGSLTFDSANGGSLVFYGTDDYVGPIAIGDHSSTARSVIIWAAADSYAQSNNDEFSVFNSTSDKFSASLGLSNHYGYFYFKSKMTHTGTYQQGIASTSLVAGSWHCWAVTINASDEIVAIYQDGESKTSGSSNGFYFRDDTYIGARMNGSTVEGSWNGKIGTVRLYTKTLSAAEIMDNFQKTRGRFGV